MRPRERAEKIIKEVEADWEGDQFLDLDKLEDAITNEIQSALKDQVEFVLNVFIKVAETLVALDG